MVGVKGFEPPTSCSQSRRATRLRYTPKVSSLLTSDFYIICKGGVFVNSFFSFPKIFLLIASVAGQAAGLTAAVEKGKMGKVTIICVYHEDRS